MSAKRPPRRYIGLRFDPKAATRREVSRAIDAAWAVALAPRRLPAPRLLFCEEGAAIVLVARGEESEARRALERGAPGGLRLIPVVTSGTIAAVKKRLRVARPRRGGQNKAPRETYKL